MTDLKTAGLTGMQFTSVGLGVLPDGRTVVMLGAGGATIAISADMADTIAEALSLFAIQVREQEEEDEKYEGEPCGPACNCSA